MVLAQNLVNQLVVVFAFSLMDNLKVFDQLECFALVAFLLVIGSFELLLF